MNINSNFLPITGLLNPVQVTLPIILVLLNLGVSVLLKAHSQDNVVFSLLDDVVELFPPHSAVVFPFEPYKISTINRESAGIVFEYWTSILNVHLLFSLSYFK